MRQIVVAAATLTVLAATALSDEVRGRLDGSCTVRSTPHQAGEVETFAIVVPAGTSIDVKSTTESGGSAPAVRVIDAGGRTVLAKKAKHNGSRSKFQLKQARTAAGGELRIVVDVQDAPSAHRLDVRVKAPAKNSATLNLAGGQATWFVEALAGANVDLRVKSKGKRGPDARIASITAPSGAVLYADGPTSGDDASRLTAVAPESGRYAVVVASSSSSGTVKAKAKLRTPYGGGTATLDVTDTALGLGGTDERDVQAGVFGPGGGELELVSLLGIVRAEIEPAAGSARDTLTLRGSDADVTPDALTPAVRIGVGGTRREALVSFAFLAPLGDPEKAICIARQSGTGFVEIPPEATERDSVSFVTVFYAEQTGTYHAFETDFSYDDPFAFALNDSSIEDDGLFGFDLALSGRMLAVGSPGAAIGGEGNSGAVRIYRAVGDDVFQEALLRPDDLDARAYFGASVAASGDLVAASATYLDGETLEPGRVYVFERLGGSWQQIARLSAPDAAPLDLFGTALEFDGDDLLISAPGADAVRGQVFVARRVGGGAYGIVQTLSLPNGESDDNFGGSLTVDGDTLVIGSSGRAFAQGSISIWSRVSERWEFFEELSDSEGIPGDEFGYSVSLEGETLAVGAPGYTDFGLEQQGAVFTLDLVQGLFELSDLHFSGTDQDLARYGEYVTVSRGHLFASLRHFSSVASNSGLVLVHERAADDLAWELLDVLSPEDTSQPLQVFGNMSVDGGGVAVGAFATDELRGEVYVFDYGK